MEADVTETTEKAKLPLAMMFYALGALIIILYAANMFRHPFNLMGLTSEWLVTAEDGGVLVRCILRPVVVIVQDGFGATTKAHPFIMGFIKLFFLGTLGEFIKFRIAKGSWGLDKSLQRAIVWGIWGLWFTLAFPAFAGAVEFLVTHNYWPGRLETAEDPHSLVEKIWIAFSKSLWINVLGMYALGMMVSHEYFNRLIATNWKAWSLTGFADATQPRFILSFLPKTLLFWIPAHTFTFSMPREWQVFIAALLAIALGFFLSVGRKS